MLICDRTGKTNKIQHNIQHIEIVQMMQKKLFELPYKSIPYNHQSLYRQESDAAEWLYFYNEIAN